MKLSGWAIPTAMAIYSSVSINLWLQPPWHVGIAVGMICGAFFATWWRSLDV